MRPMTLQQHMRRAAEQAVLGFPEALRPDIYVISLRISHGEYSTVHELWDYPYDPYMAIGYNTETNVRQNLEGSSADPLEARWNYAYMLLEESPPAGHHPADPEGTALYLEEVKRLGIWHEDEDERLCAHFDDLCIDAAKHLHSTGVVKKVLGREVPIILFDMFRLIEPDATQAANPPHLVPADYVTFQEG
ncbi:hypothetical protein [Actinomadura madurae]|uniref:hypothetical protein n=2 Tax=Actinomadura madurae TaxID=1993 RepID=UPI0020D25F65|nr:hypothetical protein [Actinomadura madurae]MCP9966921.1 hypothetical protein [Actinomadura madurae]MCP9979403.1 hypothetical protein [Actinomadura madurae]MCQ0009078.1 hypothetical protein [Actinomadura madurae]MCQ0015607.1 hypothetical protein [Actinomadura madurae]